MNLYMTEGNESGEGEAGSALIKQMHDRTSPHVRTAAAERGARLRLTSTSV